MSQSYFPSRQLATSPPPVKETSTSTFADLQREDKPLRSEDIQGAYLENKDRSVTFRASRLFESFTSNSQPCNRH
jgi:hypothetical protein